MKYNFLLRELINKKIKLDFNNLKHYSIVVFDGISLNDLKFILEDHNYLVIENRYYRAKKINFSLQIIFYFIINFLLLIRRKNISIPIIYYYTVLKIIKPKIVITSIHNSLQFHQLALLLDNQINFMAVQNAHWNDIEINSYKEKNKIEKDKYNSQIFIPNFFCFGEYEEDLAKKYNLRIKNIFKYGSIRTANYFRYIKDNNIKLIDNLYDVCLISEPLFNFNKRYKKNFIEEGVGLLTKYTIQIAKENNLKFVFATKYGKFNGEHIIKKELDFYKKLLTEEEFDYLLSNSNIKKNIYSSYDAVFQSKVVIGCHTTLLRDKIGLRQKILSCNFTDFEILNFPLKGTCSINSCNYKDFSFRLKNIINEPSDIFFNEINPKYVMEFDKEISVIKKIRNQINKILTPK
jgi:hypothetical protein